jgi:hypothetical protein
MRMTFAGGLLAQQAAGGDKWEVVELPAINEDGEALWPDAYPLEALERIRKNSQARFWSALYQQRPAPEEGDYFKAEWLRPYEKAPMRIRCGSMADLITLSPLTEEILPSTLLSESIPKGECTCSTSGESKPRPTFGLKPSATW